MCVVLNNIKSNIGYKPNNIKSNVGRKPNNIESNIGRITPNNTQVENQM
jgi:hypothetical protein